MSDVITRALLCGLGLANMTKDAIRKTAEDLVDQSKLSEEEGRKLVKDLQERSIEAERALEKKIETAVHKVLKNLNLEIIHKHPRAAGKGRAAKSRRSASSRKSGGK